jgi:hypothetical protein
VFSVCNGPVIRVNKLDQLRKILRKLTVSFYAFSKTSLGKSGPSGS